MKTLLLLRHAKSSWDDPARADHDRELNPRGEKAAPVMGRFLVREGLMPDLVWCSTAARAVQTLGLLGRQFAETDRVIYAEDLYMARETALLKCLQQTHDDADTVMMVGHNPGMESFALELIGHDSNGFRPDMERKFPTCALCQFTFEIDDWADVKWRSGQLQRFIKVKQLQGEVPADSDAAGIGASDASANT
ncbi:histidine phosphatase family protein [Thalassospira sp. TSL5-1]|uniref:SixA phosphatase family protein n=1 Tax=Thalassospira sp. TSL5-1 TaxID=1544451 RepID=UPI00093B7387|nr:histidine phosphatase family protein [Thalassospira sp. TSL5-1]